jgi:dCMP deaminase
VIGLGFNGFPRGVEDSDERLNDRPTKYLMVQHAEVNAVLQCVGEPRGSTAYVTHRPCANCTGVLIQAGIKRIVTTEPEAALAERFADSFAASDAMLRDTGISIEYHPVYRMPVRGVDGLLV